MFLNIKKNQYKKNSVIYLEKRFKKYKYNFLKLKRIIFKDEFD